MLTPKTKIAPSPTPPMTLPDPIDLEMMQHAIRAAQRGFDEGGIPIGAALYNHVTHTLLGTGSNQRIQKSSPTLHGEMACLESIGRLPARVLKQCTMYTTLSPCTMCSGALILFGIGRVVMGENETFVGAENMLKEYGVEVINLDLLECKNLMSRFIAENPDVWMEDIGEDDSGVSLATATSTDATARV